MSLENVGKLVGAVLFFIVAYFTYRDVRRKKLLRQGDNQFFNEVKNDIGIYDYVGSWRLIIMSILAGMAFIAWAFENS